MSQFAKILFISLLCWGSLSRAAIEVKDAKLEQDKMVLLTADGTSKIDFSEINPYAYAVLKFAGENPQWLDQETLTMSEVTYRKMLRLMRESIYPASAKHLKDVHVENGKARLILDKGLMMPAQLNPLTSSLRQTLGCQDESIYFCLGSTLNFTNPNILVRDLKPQGGFQAPDVGRAQAEALFQEARFPQELSRWMALVLEIRKKTFSGQSVVAERNELKRMQVSPMIINGEIRADFPNFQVNFTLDRLDARIMRFVKDRGEDIEKFAKYFLAHFPYQSFESNKLAMGDVMMSPGVMLRIKRKVTMNPNSLSTQDKFITKDSIQIFLSLGFGPKPDPDADPRLVSVSWSVGPAYTRTYESTRYFATEQEAKSGYWKMPVELLSSKDLSNLEPGEKLSVESGWVASANVTASSSALRVLTFRPQLNIIGTYSWLSRKFASRNPDGSMYLGLVDGQRLDLNIQGLMKSYWKLLRVPFFSYQYSRGNEGGKIFLVPARPGIDKELVELGIQSAFQSGDIELLSKYFPAANVDVNTRANSSFISWILGTNENNSAQIKIDLTKGVIEKSWIDNDHHFLVFENTQSQSSMFSLVHSPSSGFCSAWMGAEFITSDKMQMLYKLKCNYNYSAKDSLRRYDVGQAMQEMDLQAKDYLGVDMAGVSSLRKELSLQVQLGEDVLGPIARGEISGWIAKLSAEMEEVQKNEPVENFEVSQERTFLLFSLGEILAKKNPADRLRDFFYSISSSGGHEVLLQAILKRNPQAYRWLEVFTPQHPNAEMIERSVQKGTLLSEEPFQLLMNKNQWLGK